MSKKSFVATCFVPNVEELLEALFGESEKRTKLPKHFNHTALVQVNSGDGIGFDAGNLVAVSNRQNNVLLIVKDNYELRFKPHKKLNLSKRAICHVQDLIPGHTYLIGDANSFAFSKYLGHSMALIRTVDTCDVIRIDGEQIPPHYELSVPVYSK